MKHRQQRTVLITGATDGIGRALADHYEAQNARLVLVGRRARDTLSDPLFTAATYCRTDLAQPDAAEAICRFLAHHDIEQIDLLIHNAGIGAYGPVGQDSDETIRALIAVNLRAPITLTHALLPWLDHAGGRLVFISSVAAALPAPDYAAYAATKAALNGFARSLRIELRNRVAVQIMLPGATRTAMHAKSGVPLSDAQRNRFPPADRVAKQIAHAIEQRKPLATIGVSNQVLRWSGVHLRSIVDRLARRRS